MGAFFKVPSIKMIPRRRKRRNSSLDVVISTHHVAVISTKVSMLASLPWPLWSPSSQHELLAAQLTELTS